MEGSVTVTVALRYTNSKLKTDFIIKDGSGTEEDGFGENEELLFHFYRAEFVSGIRPYEGPLRGGTAITVFGTDFRNTPGLVVRFVYSGTMESNDNIIAEGTSSNSTVAVVPAQYVSSEELMVKTPRCPLTLGVGGFFFVEVSSNGRDFTPSSDGPLFFYDASEPFVESLSPEILRESGGVVVTVRGTGFPETFPSTLACVFGGGDDDEMVPATRYSAELLTCVSPARRQGIVVVTIMSYDQSFSSNGDLVVEYVGDLRIFSSWPALGPATGGTKVTVRGDGFRAEEAYACAFGSSLPPVEAVVVNDSAIVCQSPAVFSSINVTLEVLTAEDDVLAPRGSYVHRFFSTAALTDIALATAIAVDPDGNRSSSSLFFEYHEDVDISWVSPSNGPASGGTVVRVSGSGFLDLPQAACQFGDGEPTPATVISSGTLVCTASSLVAAAGGAAQEGHGSPFTNMSRAEKGVALRVAMNGVDFSPRNSSLLFLYDDDINVLSLWPDRGPATGGVRVLVRGSGFRPDEQLACRFGVQVAAAEYVRADTIACWAPPQVRVSMVSVSVTLNGQDFSSAAVAGGDDDGLGAAVFTYTDRAAVTALEPDNGPTRGGTVVTVSGMNFANSSTLLCRFGRLVTSAAVFVSAEEVTCVSPAVPVVEAGRVYLEVSDEGSTTSTLQHQDPGDDPALWTNSRVEFLFTEDPVVLAAFPASGPAAGGTRISLTGFGFQDFPQLGCRFGSAPRARMERDSNDQGHGDVLLGGATAAEIFEATAVDVTATFLSPTEVICSAPEQPLEWANSGGSGGSSSFVAGAETVRVAVTLNRQDYGLRMAQFVYYPTPEVLSVSPDRGPTSGGTMVTVSGKNLTSSGAYPGFTNGSLLCRFGGPEGETVEATPVVGGSDDAVQCLSPPDPRPDDEGKEVSLRCRKDTTANSHL